MELAIKIIQVLAGAVGFSTALVSILFFVRLHWPAPVLWFLKLFASALSPLCAVTGVFIALAGITTGSLFISILGLYNVLIFGMHLLMVTRAPDPSGSFAKAFGLDWESKISPGIKKHFIKRRTRFKLPEVPEPRMEQNIAFATLPGSGRKLLCDIWRPPVTIPPSGLAFIYLHGSAFYLLDKDFATRPFFRHLAGQGHVIMDVAYRLAPETDLMGMVSDVRKAIVWMKENAGVYGINPHRIVLGGGSAGGHLALLTAYTAHNPQFTPREQEGKDTGVCAVISLYGTTDLEALYYHTNQHLTTRSAPGKPPKPVPTKMPGWIIKKMGSEYHRLGMDKNFKNAGALAPLLGGHPDQCPEIYALYSPVTHVHPGCPPTLLIHDEPDLMAPVKTTRFLYTRLVKEKVPAVLHIIPQTDHAFDLILPNISPSAHNALYDVERFLAYMACGNS